MSSDTCASLRAACVFSAGVLLGCTAALAATRIIDVRGRPLPLSPLPCVAAAAGSLQHAPPLRSAGCGLSLDDEITGEQLTRNVQFFGRDGQERVCGAFVVVVGLGGVGSHAAAMLLRSGVGRLRLIDFDQVTLSSLNRHAVATRADVGTPKALALARHFREIAPEAEVDARVAMYEESAEAELLDGQPDCVLDCIDNIDTKVALLAACVRRGLRVLSVAGAGGKADPTRLHVSDLADSVRDPLARAVRHKLRRGHGIKSGVPVLFSTETPRCGLVAADTAGGTLTPADLQLLPGFRVRTIPVLGTTPAAFGCAAAAWTVCAIAGQPLHTTPPAVAQPEQVLQQLERLSEREHLRFGSEEGLLCDPADVAYVMSELWACRSARHGMAGDDDEPLPPPPKPSRRAAFRSTINLVLTRWDAERPATVDNLVLLTFEEAEAHDEMPGGVSAVRAAEPEFASRVDAVMARAARDHGLAV